MEQVNLFLSCAKGERVKLRVKKYLITSNLCVRTFKQQTWMLGTVLKDISAATYKGATAL